MANNIIFDMPMDEVYNSPIAYDFAQGQSHAKVHGCTFEQGKLGNALTNTGFGIAKTKNTQLDLTSDFTVCFWVKNNVIQGVTPPIGVAFFFEINEMTVYDNIQNGADVGTWVFWAIVKSNTGAKIYKNAIEVGNVLFTANSLSGWSVRQLTPDVTGGFNYTFNFEFKPIVTTSGTSKLDEVLIYDKALSQSELAGVMNGKDDHILYWVDEIKFLDLGIYVAQSTGLVDALETKEFVKVDWAGEHGVIADLERPRFKPREITLDCFFKASGYADFVLRLNEFLDLFKSANTKRLKVEIDHRKPLVYEVYMEDKSEIEKKWNNEDFIGTFSLTLIEYLPVKRVLGFFKTDTQTTINISIDSKTPFNIYWGDGSRIENLIGQNTISHTYSSNKYYQIVLAGVLEDITSFWHNGILLWSKL